MIEAAIITPLLLLILFAIVDFSVVFYVYLSLENGVSQATRFGVTNNTLPGLSREESMKTVMRDATPTLTIPDGDFEFSHLSGGSWASGPGNPGDVEKLTVRYTHNVFVLKPFFPGGAINLEVESSMKLERAFEE
jgi:TadE-like protein